MTKPLVLIVEDETASARLYQLCLEQGDFETRIAATGADALDIIKKQNVAALVLDLSLPDMDGLDVLRQTTAPAIVVTAHGSVRKSVEAMRAGAYDFLIKPFTVTNLLSAVSAALNEPRSAASPKSRSALTPSTTHRSRASAMRPIYETIDSAARSKATIFITGESGTGKEVCAEDIHRHSPRADKPFVALNCAAIPKDLIESEIFGHVKGAFTGAAADRDGAAALADGGTLFLDELCEMDMALQSKLLRFIQTGSFNKVGSSQRISVDVRFLCATNRNPMEEVQAGRFREDLFYRLYVIPLELPPLRARGGADILDLATHFLRHYAAEEGKSFEGFAPDAAALLTGYSWPGNVRQLQNSLQQTVVLHPGGLVTAEMLPVFLRSPPVVYSAASTAVSAAAIRPLWKVEKDCIQRALAYCQGNIRKAAKMLEIDASTIHRKMKSWQDT